MFQDENYYTYILHICRVGVKQKDKKAKDKVVLKREKYSIASPKYHAPHKEGTTHIEQARRDDKPHFHPQILVPDDKVLCDN